MTSEAQWILGEVATERLGLLSERMFSQIKAEAEAELGTSFARYSPWMAMPTERKALSPLIQQAKLPAILIESESLRILAAALKTDEKNPFGKLGLDEEKSDSYIFSGSPSEAAAAEAMIEQARELFLSSDANLKKRYEILIQTIVPLEVVGVKSSFQNAFSSHFLKGAIFRTIPRSDFAPWRIEFAIALAHEVGHQALMVYQAADRLIASDLGASVYSGVRKTQRPAIMSLHAAAALAYMIEYIEIELRRADKTSRLSTAELDYAEAQSKQCRTDLGDTLKALEQVEFTPLGKLIYDEYRNLHRQEQ